MIKFDYYPYMSHIAANIEDEGFTKAELYELKQLASKIQERCTKAINRLKTRG